MFVTARCLYLISLMPLQERFLTPCRVCEQFIFACVMPKQIISNLLQSLMLTFSILLLILLQMEDNPMGKNGFSIFGLNVYNFLEFNQSIGDIATFLLWRCAKPQLCAKSLRYSVRDIHVGWDINIPVEVRRRPCRDISFFSSFVNEISCPSASKIITKLYNRDAIMF